MEWNVASDRNRARQLNLTHARAPTDALLSNPLELERASLSDAENIFNVVQSSEFIKHNLGPHCITIRGDPTIAQYTNPSGKICARPIWDGITTENFVCFHVLCNKKERHRVFWRIFACLMVQWPACHQMIDQRERLPARLHAFLLQQQRARRTAEKPVLMCLPKLSASAFVMKFFLPISFFSILDWIDFMFFFLPVCYVHCTIDPRFAKWAMKYPRNVAHTEEATIEISRISPGASWRRCDAKLFRFVYRFREATARRSICWQAK